MKLLISLIFIINIAYANYAFSKNNSKKIDMHGGKPTQLLDKKRKLEDKEFKSLNSFNIKKPSRPKVPDVKMKETKSENLKKGNK